jgi:hypothetical protein
MSKIMSSSVTAPASLQHRRFGGIELLAADHVDRDRDGRAARGHLLHQRLRRGHQVVLAQRLADVLARGLEEGVGDAAADHHLVDLVRQRFEHGQLGRHLGAADDGHHRPRRVGQRLVQGFEFLGHQQAGTGGRGELRHAVGRGFGTVGGAEGVHDKEVAQRGVFLRRRFDVLLLALVEAAVLQQHDFAGGDIESAIDPVAHQAHRLPSLAAMTSATGWSEFSSVNTPSSGRPRWEVTMTLAPALRQCAMVGIDAVMRASEVTLPSLTGTLRSARMKTRLPARSKSERRLKLMFLPLSSVRLLQPATCLTKRSMLQV